MQTTVKKTKSIKLKNPISPQQAAVLLLLLLMFMFPKNTLKGAENGLLLWYKSLLPVLFPFIFISGIVIRLNIVPYLSKILYPVLKIFFPITQNASYPVMIGFLSGLPIGAKVSAEMAYHKDIRKEEAEYVSAMCNNASPAFIMSFCAATCLNDSSKSVLLLAIIYISAIIASGIVYHTGILKKKKQNDLTQTSAFEPTEIQKTSIITTFDQAIMSAFEAVTKIGGYVILFSIFSELTALLPLPEVFRSCLGGLLEISTGVKSISLLNLSADTKFILIAGFTAFGGLSAAAQTKSVTAESQLKMKPYLLSKIIQGLIAAVISSCIV